MKNRIPIDAVALDLDGLMFNTEQLYEEVGGELVRRRGHQLDLRLLRQMMGRPAAVALQLMIDWYGLEDSIEQLERETDEIFAALLGSRLAPMPGLVPLLQWLDQRGIPKAIVTSSRLRFVQQILAISRLETRFAFALTAEDVRRGKPDPEVYLLAAARFGVAPPAMLVLEDSENGCRAAVAAGATVVAVPGPHSRDHDFRGVLLVANGLADPGLRQLLDMKD